MPIENTADTSENSWLVKENPQKTQDDKDHQNAETIQVEVPKAPINQDKKDSKRRERDSDLKPERLKAVKITRPIWYEIIVDSLFNGEEALQQEQTCGDEACFEYSLPLTSLSFLPSLFLIFCSVLLRLS